MVLRLLFSQRKSYKPKRNTHFEQSRIPLSKTSVQTYPKDAYVAQFEAVNYVELGIKDALGTCEDYENRQYVVGSQAYLNLEEIYRDPGII